MLLVLVGITMSQIDNQRLLIPGRHSVKLNKINYLHVLNWPGVCSLYEELL
jgi:hypothetical protein